MLNENCKEKYWQLNIQMEKKKNKIKGNIGSYADKEGETQRCRDMLNWNVKNHYGNRKMKEQEIEYRYYGNRKMEKEEREHRSLGLWKGEKIYIVLYLIS